jgi:hypothetical protein
MNVLGRIWKETVVASTEELSRYLTRGTTENYEHLPNESVEHYRHSNPLDLRGRCMATEAMSFGENGGEHLENLLTG